MWEKTGDGKISDIWKTLPNFIWNNNIVVYLDEKKTDQPGPHCTCNPAKWVVFAVTIVALGQLEVI